MSGFQNASPALQVANGILQGQGLQFGTAPNFLPFVPFLTPPAAPAAPTDPKAQAEAASDRRLRGRSASLLYGVERPNPAGVRQSGATLLGQ